MTHLTRTLVALTALLGATAAFAADQLQTRDRLHDGTCLEQTEDGTECLLLADQLRLRDGSCLEGDGTRQQTRARVGEDSAKGEVARTRK